MNMRSISSTLFALILGAFALAPEARAQEYKPPLYRAARAQDEIHVDGKLDEFTWAALPRVGRFIDIRDHNNPDALDTQATLAWDNTNLYIAFACVDPEPWGTMMQRDQHLWNEEVVEVFLDPDGDGHDYPELEVSPHNIVVDLLIPHRPDSKTDPSVAAHWDIAGLKTAVGKYSAGWTVEISIPWASLAGSGIKTAPKEGDRWRVGLYRIERPGGPSQAAHLEELRKKVVAAPAGEKATLSKELETLENKNQDLAWSPTRHTFHDPERFGIVEFVLRP